MISIQKNTALYSGRSAKNFDKNMQSMFSWVHIDKPALQGMLMRILGLTPYRLKILDIACGSGRIIDLLHSLGARESNITGIDFSEELLHLAHEKFNEAHFIHGDITEYDAYPQASFDIATAVHIFSEFTVADLEKTFLHIHKALKAGGVFVFLVGHPFRYIKTGYFTNKAYKQKTPWGAEVTHYHKTIADYLNTTKRAGFVIEMIVEPQVHGGEDNALYKDYKKTPSRLLVVARKVK